MVKQSSRELGQSARVVTGSAYGSMMLYIMHMLMADKTLGGAYT